MSNVLLISHLIVTVFLILVVLFQRSEGGGLGMGSDNQGFGTGTKSANPLSKLTWFLTALFFLIAILLTILSINSGSNKSVFEESEGAKEPDKRELTPMILKDIAEDLKLDISTISRVTNGKYVQLPFGIYELKEFFSEGIKNKDGDMISNTVVKNRLKEIIHEEDKTSPFGDEELALKLQNEGFQIGRRDGGQGCPLRGRGVSPRRFSTRHRAAVISDFPAPLLVPSTMSGVWVRAWLKVASRRVLQRSIAAWLGAQRRSPARAATPAPVHHPTERAGRRDLLGPVSQNIPA